MSTDYAAILNAVVAELAIVAPGRVISLEYLDFAVRPQAQLVSGVISVLPNGVAGYPYEHRPGDCGQFGLLITAQGVLPENCTGAQINAAEFSALNQLEALAAREHDLPEILAALTLRQAIQSAQLEKPYWWVMTRWDFAHE